eukprot:jgi/Mesen1/5261/ME000263S04369
MTTAAANGGSHPAGDSGRSSSVDVSGSIDKIKKAGLLKGQCLVGDSWIDADSGATLDVTNPATGEVVQAVATVGAAETERAIEAAAAAYKKWSAMTPKARGKLLRAWYDAIEAHREELGALMTLEQGKPLKESLGEVTYGADYVEFYAEEATRAYGDILPSPHPERRILVIRQPVGVVGIITPWNFPIAMITRKVAPALAAGNAVVVKPASQTPLCALAIAELALRAGIPPGVVNVVVGESKPIGSAILSSSSVAKFSFTGSTNVGKKLMAQAAESIKKVGGLTLALVSLELGGNAPVIIFDDADLEKAAQGALAAKYRNSGQTCVCANRILVQSGLASYIYTENIARGWRVSEALEYGMVGFNETAISTPYAPFGGVKQSGFGREGSKYGLDEYMH